MCRLFLFCSVILSTSGRGGGGGGEMQFTRSSITSCIFSGTPPPLSIQYIKVSHVRYRRWRSSCCMCNRRSWIELSRQTTCMLVGYNLTLISRDHGWRIRSRSGICSLMLCSIQICCRSALLAKHWSISVRK